MSSNIEAVIGLGMHADEAWQMWKTMDDGQKLNVIYAPITHPTQPESFSGGDKNKLREATKKMLQNWNKGLETIASAIKHPDNRYHWFCMVILL